MTQTTISPSLITEHLPLAQSVLDNLALRLRPGGLCLILLRPDGAIAYNDGAAGTFFSRYVIPQIQYPDPAVNFRQNLATITASSTVTVWNILPGVTIAVFPYIERRQLTGLVLVAGKSQNFKLGEDVVRVCGTLGLDGIWLGQQAEELPSYGDDAIQRQARLLLTMLRDQVRLGGLEQELNSLSGQLANTYEELSLIYQTSGGMRVNRRPNDFFKQACLDVLETIGVRGMGIALQVPGLEAQEPMLYGPLSLPPGKVARLSEELLQWLTRRKVPLLINDLSKDKTWGWLSDHARRLLAVPLQREEQVLGCFFGIDKESGDFDSVDSKLLSAIANESAIYLENAVLFDDVHGLMMGLLHSLSSAIDAKDAYTCGHSERVASLSKMLATRSGMTEAEAERLYIAGLLHDVGKIGVPEAVLQKPGKLTPEEFEQMKKHPQIGARILQNIKQLKDVLKGVMHHHERFDGRGYPCGLSGLDIPIMGRIICLADCFDAMTTTRTYRSALPLEVALMEIRRCSGTQFDPELTDAFLAIGVEQFRQMLLTHHAKWAAHANQV